jgi:hypothetical protein
MGLLALAGVASLTVLLVALLTNIFERKQEARQPFVRVVEVTEDTMDPKVWGQNWPSQYDSYLRTSLPTTTKYGGRGLGASDTGPAEQKLDRDPWLKRIFAGYAFALDYRDRRGHAYALFDQEQTRRVTEKQQPGACLQCHASNLALYRFVGKGDEITPYLKGIALWILGQAGGLGTLFLQLLLTVVMSAILYSNGEGLASAVLAFARRLGGSAGERVAVLAAQAIRAVALGIVVTALVQSVIGGIGLVLTGVPYASLLTAVLFLLGIAQIGPVPVLLGAVVWLYWKDETVWGTVMVVWSLVTASLDNFLRPVLIRRGADLPLLLIFAGVLGGLLAFGVVGLFIGPVVLAVTYTLLQAWVEEGQAAADRPAQDVVG